jgi:transcriptional regulator with XRE-family HTH domain
VNTKLIKDLRVNKGLTQKDLARMVGISERGYQLYEHGERIPDAQIATRIAKALHTTVEQLWGASPTTA